MRGLVTNLVDAVHVTILADDALSHVYEDFREAEQRRALRLTNWAHKVARVERHTLPRGTAEQQSQLSCTQRKCACPARVRVRISCLMLMAQHPCYTHTSWARDWPSAAASPKQNSAQPATRGVAAAVGCLL